MRIRPDDFGVNERRAFTSTAIFDGALHHRVRRERISAVNLLNVEIGETGDEFRDIAARGIHLDRSRDRVAVVFDDEDHRQFEIACGVQRFPPFAFARRAVADRHIDDLIAFEPGDLVLKAREQRRSIARLGGSDRVERLRTCARRLRRNVEILMSETVHLSELAVGIKHGLSNHELIYTHGSLALNLNE